MRFVLLVYVILFFSILTSAESSKCQCITNQCRMLEAIRTIKTHLEKRASPKAVPAPELAPAILRVSLKYGIRYELLTAVILVESRGVSTAFNKRTNDHGLGQINIKTARAMGLTMICLYNWKCNLDATAKILSTINDGLVCRYNVGTMPKLYGKLLINCQKYERKVAQMQ